MDHYIKQAMLIKTLAKRSNPDIKNQTQTPVVNNNRLTFGNNNDTDYYTQAKTLLMNFIADPDKLDEIVNMLNDSNDKYLKEITLNWSTYEGTLQSLKGSVVSVGRVVDILKDKLNTALSRKTFISPTYSIPTNNSNVQINNPNIPVRSNSDILPFFFDLNTQTMNNLEDSKKIVKLTLAEILGLDANSSDKTFLQAMDTAISRNDSNVMLQLDQYKSALSGSFKTDAITLIVNQLQKHFPDGLKMELFDAIVDETNKMAGDAFGEKFEFNGNKILSKTVKSALESSNVRFVITFLNAVGRVIQYRKNQINPFQGRTESKSEVDDPFDLKDDMNGPFKLKDDAKHQILIPFFFNIQKQTLNKLQDSKDILRRVLTKILNLNSESNDETILHAMNKVLSKNDSTSNNIYYFLDVYKLVLERDKKETIDAIINILKNRFPNGVSNFFLDSVIRAINYGTSPDDVFDENISFTGDEIPYSKLRAAFESSNMQFLNRFAHKVGMSLKTFKPADLPVEKVGEKFTPEEVNKMTNDKNVYDQIKEDSSKLTDFIYDKFTSNYTAYRNLAAFLNAFNMISPVEKEILTRNASSKDKAKKRVN